MKDKVRQESQLQKYTIKPVLYRNLALLLAGALLAFSLRFVLVNNEVVHYHANFALYINGQQDEFKSFTNYEEVAACSGENTFDPKSRTHMHEQVNSVIHVHDAGATWGHFTANLGYSLSNNLIETQQGIFQKTDTSKLRFILNGEAVDSIANQTIRSEDRLLIDYGSDSDAIVMQRYANVANSAHENNEKPDPQSCSGGAKESLKNRFKRTLGIALHPADNEFTRKLSDASSHGK